MLALATGCEKSVTGPDVPLTGDWAGSDGGVYFATTLVQTGTSVTGTGNVDGFGLNSDFTVSGSYVLESLVLTLTTAKYGTWQFSGAKHGSTITGMVTSASYPDLPVSLTRQ